MTNKFKVGQRVKNVCTGYVQDYGESKDTPVEYGVVAQIVNDIYYVSFENCDYTNPCFEDDIEPIEEPQIKLEAGKTYELNNGEVHKCTEMKGTDPDKVDKYGCGPFIIDGCRYLQDGRFNTLDKNHKYSVKRCVDEDQAEIMTN